MDVRFTVEFNGETQEIDGPLEVSLSVMELLKAYDYPIEATCGGMGLCGSCHCFVEGDTSLFPIGDDEADTLDNIPFSNPKSRLTCQLRVHSSLQGHTFHLKPGG
jgi:2Fe-2S ferredoxin